LTPVDGVMLSNRGAFLPYLNVSRSSALVAIVTFLLIAGALVWFLAARRFRRLELSSKLRWCLLIMVCGGAGIVFVLWSGRIPDTLLVSVPEPKGLSIAGGLYVPTALLAMIISMAIFGGAYIGEIVRGGFE